MLPRFLRTVFLGTLLVSGAHADVINRLAVRQSSDSVIVIPGTTTTSTNDGNTVSTSTITATDSKSTSTIVSTTVSTSTSTSSSSSSSVVTTTARSTTVSSTTSTSTPSTTITTKESSSVAPSTITTSTSQSQVYTTIIVTTGGGSTWSSTSTGTSSSTSSTAAPITSDGSATSGLDANTRKTVIGVVCGVGGAIFLALIFLVVWKLWGRRRTSGSDDDGLMMDSNLGEKNEGKKSLNPFKTTLENYHNPSSKPVNASSNF